ncbi:MAG TPA: branched-chain amino acid ABC transporter substrate-binding protein [Burkholderiales bacterium]|nr:branched-chain amino acid ABC transporter substrate-binding protein [Burkholderiales bacterium]
MNRTLAEFVKYAAVAAALVLTAPAAPAKQTVRIAFIGPLTGGVSANGIGGRNSADLAVRIRNEDPKTKYQYELVSLDDECKPNIAVQAATKAAADSSIIAGVTHYCSVTAIATVDTYHKFGFPVVVWGAVLPDITYRNQYAEVHRVNGTMINQNEVAAKFMTGLGYKRWVVIHDTTDYGKGHDRYFTEYVLKAGGQVVGRFGVTADQQDFTAELTKAKELKPDVIYFGGLTPLGVRIRSQMEKLGIQAQFEGTSGIKSDAFIDGLGARLAEGSLSFIEGAPWEKLPGGLYFVGKYQGQKYNEGPEAYGPFAFAAANLIIDAIEKVGPSRKRVIEELGKTRDMDSIIGKITFDDHGQNIVPLITKYVVQDGKWVVWEESEYGKGTRKLKGR